jgi:hypothetical protein
LGSRLSAIGYRLKAREHRQAAPGRFGNNYQTRKIAANGLLAHAKLRGDLHPRARAGGLGGLFNFCIVQKFTKVTGDGGMASGTGEVSKLLRKCRGDLGINHRLLEPIEL